MVSSISIGINFHGITVNREIFAPFGTICASNNIWFRGSTEQNQQISVFNQYWWNQSIADTPKDVISTAEC